MVLTDMSGTMIDKVSMDIMEALSIESGHLYIFTIHDLLIKYSIVVA